MDEQHCEQDEHEQAFDARPVFHHFVQEFEHFVVFDHFEHFEEAEEFDHAEKFGDAGEADEFAVVFLGLEDELEGDDGEDVDEEPGAEVVPCDGGAFVDEHVFSVVGAEEIYDDIK